MNNPQYHRSAQQNRVRLLNPLRGWRKGYQAIVDGDNLHLRISALVVWVLDSATTSLFLGQLGLVVWAALLCGVIGQYLITLFEEPVLMRYRADPVGIIFIVVNSLMNAAGLWTLLGNLGSTSLWQMFAEVTGNPASQPTAIVRFSVAVVFGVITSIGFSVLWGLADRESRQP